MKSIAEELEHVGTLLSQVESLPTLPELVRRLEASLRNPNSNIRDIADMILKDQVLTAHVIRLANSSFFAVHREVRNIREAIVFLGFRTLHNLVLTSGLLGTFRWPNRSVDPKQFWEHSLATAIVSRDIATRLGYRDLEEAYLSGLVHDLGIVVISQCLPDRMEQILQRIEGETISLYDAEKEVLGIGHPAFGAWLGKKWSFSQELVEVMFWHHEPVDDLSDPGLVAIVSLADIFCRSRNLGCGLREYWNIAIHAHPAWPILRERFPIIQDSDWERFALDLDAKAEEFRFLVSAVFDSQN